MSIPGKALIAFLSALAVSAIAAALLENYSMTALLAPTSAAALLAVLLSHRALPMPSALVGRRESGTSTRSSPNTTGSTSRRPASSSAAATESKPRQKARTKPATGARDKGGRTADAGSTRDPRDSKSRLPETAASGDLESGTVKWFNGSKGFGFIVRDNGDEIFVHHRSIQGEGRGSLRDGAPVRFRVVTTDKGPQAEDVEAGD